MNWKTWLSAVICLGLVALMILGIVTRADHRIVIADAIGAVVAARVVLIAWMVRRPSAVSSAVLLLKPA